MFDFSQNTALAGSGHIFLNVLRACTIVTLICISISCWIMVVMTGINHSFFFFDAMSQIFASTISIFLIISEVGIFRDFFERNWPVFSTRRGLTWLGCALTVLACHVLGELNRPQLSQAAIGMDLWRMLIASGILGLIFGFMNIVASIIFRDSDHNINARNIRSDGSLAGNSTYAASYTSSTRSNSLHGEKTSAARRWTQKLSPFNNGGRPKISKPFTHDIEANAGAGYPPPIPAPGYAEDRSSPIVPGLLRPQTALHPMNSAHSDVSRYSVVSHLNRF
ncbi:hypothetical protein TD95_001063 [Thielaviopsis punctulata]|uniref:DUF7598 domain-containing protein n=1 Tax=Thielaviopsis punctulata TaxID=72032 RepID=A0A0F4Z9U7_9PEZI|nr:hypothetical protein TD95_001063 [Thielaviopsis punctulata]